MYHWLNWSHANIVHLSDGDWWTRLVINIVPNVAPACSIRLRYPRTILAIKFIIAFKWDLAINIDHSDSLIQRFIFSAFYMLNNIYLYCPWNVLVKHPEVFEGCFGKCRLLKAASLTNNICVLVLHTPFYCITLKYMLYSLS